MGSSFLKRFGLLAVSLIPGVLSSISAVNTVVDLGYATYRGNLSFPNTVAYLGLPYAEPPLGERRFRAPITLDTARIQAEAGGKIIDASSNPAFCIQGSIGRGDAGGAGSEDCLKVNVYVPVGAKQGDKLPVLVYIHGGGYVYGNPANFPLDHWVHQVPEVVIVSVYYRLDSLGFLAHPDFATSNLGDFNVGFQDQTEALRWVQRHINAFGGDPGRVTINGHSAGSSSVELHLTAPNNIGLFHAGIAQSVYRITVPTPAAKLSTFNTFTQNAGCGSGSVSAQMSCLRKASVSVLAQAQDATSGDPHHIFIPVQDPKTIPIPPTTAILQGKFHGVPLIVGATSNETLSTGSGNNITQSLLAFWPLLTRKDIDDYATQYPSSDFISSNEQYRDTIGESGFRCAREIMGGGFGNKAKAFTYRYNQPDPTSGSNLVEHAAENYMLFRGIETGVNGTGTFHTLNPIQTAFSEELIAYWLSFVRSGDPNTFKLARSPIWPAYGSDQKRVLLQQGATSTKSGISVEVSDQRVEARCAFVASKASVEQN
ncbi:hypothetical protein NLI96_g6700 [Meripilus lineatus]|uniref:Carboxylic ester hydrolase n=1 Tax=Meripilus lineatus TaxID=2056292 RepID=A0AAD5YFP1_9APHY|nr:hypothetical protein NLI96_g6700 [Physisporinus lineatus]